MGSFMGVEEKPDFFLCRFKVNSDFFLCRFRINSEELNWLSVRSDHQPPPSSAFSF